MTTIEIVRINDRFIKAWNQHNVIRFLALCDDNIIYRINNGTETFKEKNEVKNYFNNWITAFPNLAYRVCNWIADDTIAVEYEFTGIHNGILSVWTSLHELQPTHWKVITCGSYFLKLKNGKITEATTYSDRFSLFDSSDYLKKFITLAFDVNKNALHGDKDWFLICICF